MMDAAVILVLPKNTVPLGYIGHFELSPDGPPRVILQRFCSRTCINESQKPVTLVWLGDDLGGKGRPVAIVGANLNFGPNEVNITGLAFGLDSYSGYAFNARTASEVLESILHETDCGLRRL